MDEDLVEKITRMVLSKLEEYSNLSILNEYNSRNKRTSALNTKSEYSPLTQEDLKQWGNIASTIGLSKITEEVSSYLAPLNQEELKTWKDLSASIGFRSSVPAVMEKQTDYLPLTEEEVKSWNQLEVTKPVLLDKERWRNFGWQ